jgi:hypothetical protein
VMIWDIFLQLIESTVKNNQKDPWLWVSFSCFFGRIGMEWPLSYKKTNKLQTITLFFLGDWCVNELQVKLKKTHSGLSEVQTGSLFSFKFLYGSHITPVWISQNMLVIEPGNWVNFTRKFIECNLTYLTLKWNISSWIWNVMNKLTMNLKALIHWMIICPIVVRFKDCFFNGFLQLKNMFF